MSKNERKPKVLYVFSLLPAPPEIGVHHRILNVGRQLKKYADLQAVYVGPPYEENRMAATEHEFGPVQRLLTPDVRRSGILYKFKFHWPWFFAESISCRDRQLFLELCKKQGLVWMHTLTTADSVGTIPFRNTLVDLDDLNYLKYKLMQKTAATQKQKIAAGLLAYKWKKREQKAADQYSWLAVCSEEDRKQAGHPDRTVVIPNGYVRPQAEPVWHDRTGKILGFMGYVGYGPNRHGLEWFVRQVWPRVLQRIPEARVHVMGHVPDPGPFSRVDGLDLLGYVENTEDEMAHWSAMVVPLRVGGGTRLKILDAFSKKCPVVSTRTGAYGLNICHGKNIFLADQPDAFADQCVRLLNTPSLGRSLAENGWQLFCDQYTWEKVGERIDEILKRIFSEWEKTDTEIHQ